MTGSSRWFALLLILIQPVWAQNGSESLAKGMGSEIKGYLSLEHYRVLGMDFSMVEFPEIMKTMGETKLIKGSHGTKMICYEDDSKIRMSYERTVKGFGYSLGLEAEEDSTWSLMIGVKCARSPKDLSATYNSAGLGLGMSFNDVTRLMGMPTTREDDDIEYRYWAQETRETKKGKKVTYDIYSIVTITLKQDRVNYISVYTTLTE